MGGIAVLPKHGSQQGVPLLREQRIPVQNVLGVVSGIGEDEPVLGQGGNVQRDGQAALLSAFQVSGAAPSPVRKSLNCITVSPPASACSNQENTT